MYKLRFYTKTIKIYFNKKTFSKIQILIQTRWHDGSETLESDEISVSVISVNIYHTILILYNIYIYYLKCAVNFRRDVTWSFANNEKKQCTSICIRTVYIWSEIVRVSLNFAEGFITSFPITLSCLNVN